MTGNWVERRLERQRLLHAQAPELWNQIRAAIQDACESFNGLYAADADHKVFCELENGHRLRIHRTLPPAASFEQPKHLEALVHFHKADHTVSITFESGAHTFYIDADHESAVFIGADRTPDASKLTPDQVSQRVLEAILFPKP